MRRWLGALLVLTLAPNASAKAPGKLITVVTASWAATTGELQRWERDRGRWRAVGERVAVVVGRGGLKLAPDKREGDGASPAGRFALGGVTGYDTTPPAGTRLPYAMATSALRCVDDARSPDYNRVTKATIGEEMRRDDQLYRFTIFVRHNPTQTPGMGSCIFLHAWRDADSPTVGCTAMALPRLRELVVWADSSTELVQLPREEYTRRQRAWDLPQRK
jgi:L,D-peptidoglycan transpeptidase YkuD (ErfK/YbiS/YcfS/YnhG family)